MIEKSKKYVIGFMLGILALGVGIFAGTGALVIGKNVVPIIKSFATKNIPAPVNHVMAEVVETVPAKITLGNITDAMWTAPEKGKVIRVNLETMKLDLYKDGVVEKSYTVVGKGKTGSYWETPGGEYSVETKEENHFSTTGKVWMPYSMEFFGNYFIHGWPYYPGGKEVEAGFSGGCIRLATSDAKEVYEWADYNTGISIYSDSAVMPKETAENSDYFIKDKNHIPYLTAESYIVGDLDTGDIILSKDENVAHPIASLSKVMTALVELDVVNQQNNSTISKSAFNTEGANGGLQVGEKIKNSELIYPLLLESSNDAAEALAEYHGRAEFIKKMNDKAYSIGLSHTHFEDPSGLTPMNVSSALDLFTLTSYIGKYKSFVWNATTKSYRKYEDHVWRNINPFVKTEGYMGGKTGYTDQAGETLISLFSLPLSEFHNRTIAVILLKSDNRYEDAMRIMDYLKKNVSYGIHESFAVADTQN